MLKSKAKKRDWSEALDKLEEEGRCRACMAVPGTPTDGSFVVLECAHTIGRKKQDELVIGPKGGETLVVKREATIPLCRDCHRQYDEHRLDLLPFLFLPEQVEAVGAAGGITAANRRLSGAR